MEKNQLYWIFIVSLYKITKIIDYNRAKMDYKATIFWAIRLFSNYFQKTLSKKNNQF